MLSAAALHGTAYLTRDEIFLHPYLQSGPSLKNLQNSFFWTRIGKRNKNVTEKQTNITTPFAC